ncbi:DMT family transporter [Ferruginibacter profundus]
MQNEHYPTNLKIILAFAAIYIIWGSTFYGVHIALQSFPPFLLSALRFLIAGTVLLLYCIIKKEKLPAAADIRKNAVCGLVLFIGGVVSVVWSQQYISSSLASIIITTPFWFVVLDKKQWAYYFSSKWIIAGLISGLLGVILLLGFKKGRAGSSDEYMQVLSICCMIGGSFLWVSGSLYLKYNPSTTSPYVNSSIQLLSAGIFCLLISLFRQEPQHLVISSIQTNAAIALFYLAIVSTLVTFMAYIWLIKVRPPAIVSTYSYVNPVVAVLLGWGLGGESISWLQIIALVIILSGVLLVNIPRYKAAL